MPQIVFITLFLGLVSGPQPVELHVDPGIAYVQLIVDGKVASALRGAPWKATIDLGHTLVPRQVVAIGYDVEGAEIVRASQTLNLPRPMAEAELLIERSTVALRWSHRFHAQPTQATISLDGKPLTVRDDFRATLPKLDATRPHLITAELQFPDDVVIRREAVLAGSAGYSDSTHSELSAIAVRDVASARQKSLDGCFTANDKPLRTSAVEKTQALVIMVKDPDAAETLRALEHAHGPLNFYENHALRRLIPLDRDTAHRTLWPVDEAHVRAGEPTMNVFPRSNEVEASEGGMLWLLTRAYPADGVAERPRRFADAVATAAVLAQSEARRRAVVLLVGDAPDRSQYSAITSAAISTRSVSRCTSGRCAGRDPISPRAGA